MRRRTAVGRPFRNAIIGCNKNTGSYNPGTYEDYDTLDVRKIEMIRETLSNLLLQA